MRRRIGELLERGFLFLSVLSATVSTRSMVYTSPPIPSAPIVMGDRLVFADGDRKNIVCIDRRDGKVYWETNVPDGNAAVTVSEGRIFAGAKRAVYEIDGAGKLLRLFGTKFEHSQILRANNAGVLLASRLADMDDGVISLHDFKTGKLKWRFADGDLPIALIDDTLLYAKNRYISNDKDRTTIGALDLKSGKRLWSETVEDRIVEGEAVGEFFVVAFAADLEELRVIHQRSGKVVKRLDLSGGVFHLGMHEGAATTWHANTRAQVRKMTNVPWTVVSNYAAPKFEPKKVAEFDKAITPLEFWQNIVVAREHSENHFERGEICAFDRTTKQVLWRMGSDDADWNGVFDGVIYVSAVETDGQATVTAVHLTTGSKTVLYRDGLHATPQRPMKRVE